mgnify:CR=1 FL=1
MPILCLIFNLSVKIYRSIVKKEEDMRFLICMSSFYELVSMDYQKYA